MKSKRQDDLEVLVELIEDASLSPEIVARQIELVGCSLFDKTENGREILGILLNIDESRAIEILSTFPVDILKTDCTMINANGETPLLSSARRRKFDFVCALSKFSDLSVLDNNGWGLGMWLATSDRIDILTTMMDANVRMDVPNKVQTTPIQRIVEHGSPEMLEVICKKGALKDIVDSQGSNLLILAQNNKKHASDITRILLREGVNPCLKNNMGKTSLNSAATSGTPASFEMLWKATKACGEEVRGNIHKAILRDNLTMNMVIMNICDLEERDDGNKTLLHTVLDRGVRGADEIIKRKPGFAMVRDDFGRLPLHILLKRRSNPINVWEDLMRLTDLFEVDSKGRTFESIALEQGLTEIANLIVAHKERDSFSKDTVDYKASSRRRL